MPKNMYKEDPPHRALRPIISSHVCVFSKLQNKCTWVGEIFVMINLTQSLLSCKIVRCSYVKLSEDQTWQVQGLNIIFKKPRATAEKFEN